ENSSGSRKKIFDQTPAHGKKFRQRRRHSYRAERSDRRRRDYSGRGHGIFSAGLPGNFAAVCGRKRASGLWFALSEKQTPARDEAAVLSGKPRADNDGKFSLRIKYYRRGHVLQSVSSKRDPIHSIAMPRL